MKNITLRRALALCLALVMMLAMAACAPQGGSKSGSEKVVENTYEGDTLLAPGTEFKITIPSHASWPYDKDWAYWKYFRERVGGDIKVSSIMATEFATKVNLMMATPDELPDLLYDTAKTTVNAHASSNALIAVDDHLDLMPNYKKFLDSLDPVVREELLMQRVYSDGKVYQPPVYGSQSTMNFRTWMYRQDIFEKHNLEVPTNLDELYDVCKQLKKLYPDSYPLCFRSGLGQLEIMGPTWANDFSLYQYYDFQDEEWKFGAFTDTMKEMVLFFKKMLAEGLVPPDFMTIATASWEELISNDRGFIMPEYLVRITYFNTPNQKRNPDYQWVAMAPPAKDAKTDHHRIAKVNLDQTGYMLPNTGDGVRIGNALKVLDWMYSDEAVELFSWGKEGETYEMVNGEKKLILKGDETLQNLYGVATYGLYQVIEEAAFNQAVAPGSEIDPAMQTWPEDHANPSLYLSFNEEESGIINMHASALTAYVEENITHFIDGSKPMSEWDQYVADGEKLGLEEYLSVYESAYNRTMGK